MPRTRNRADIDICSTGCVQTLTYTTSEKVARHASPEKNERLNVTTWKNGYVKLTLIDEISFRPDKHIPQRTMKLMNSVSVIV